jgi:Fe-S cluster biogenesis protein NfuA
MDKTRKLIAEILNSMRPLIEAHKGFAELGEVKGNRAVIYCGGQCIDCSIKCIEDAIKEKWPGVEIVFL